MTFVIYGDGDGGGGNDSETGNPENHIPIHPSIPPPTTRNALDY